MPADRADSDADIGAVPFRVPVVGGLVLDRCVESGVVGKLAGLALAVGRVGEDAGLFWPEEVRVWVAKTGGTKVEGGAGPEEEEAQE